MFWHTDLAARWPAAALVERRPPPQWACRGAAGGLRAARLLVS